MGLFTLCFRVDLPVFGLNYYFNISLNCLDHLNVNRMCDIIECM